MTATEDALGLAWQEFGRWSNRQESSGVVSFWVVRGLLALVVWLDEETVPRANDYRYEAPAKRNV